MTPTLEQRCESWDNYANLFNVILHGNVNMQLPNLWLWEMIDEFIYQFQSLPVPRQAQLKAKEELAAPRVRRQGHLVAEAVMNYLTQMVDKSEIVSVLDAERRGKFSEAEKYDYNSSNVLRTLATSPRRRLRVRILPGLRGRPPRPRSHRPGQARRLHQGCGASVSAAYHRFGASCSGDTPTPSDTSTRRWCSSTDTRWPRLSRTRSTSSQEAEQMYALVAMAVTLGGSGAGGGSNGNNGVMRLLEGVVGSLREKQRRHGPHGPGRRVRLRRDVLLLLPQVVTPSPPEAPGADGEGAGASFNEEAYRAQLKTFIAGGFVREAPRAPLYLKLYTTISVAKLADLMEIEPAQLGVLATMKAKSVVTEWRGASAPTASTSPSRAVVFVVEGEAIHVQDVKRRSVTETISSATSQAEHAYGGSGAGEASGVQGDPRTSGGDGVK